MLANSLDASGSSGRPIAADQKRPTTRASRQSNTTQAILTVIEPPERRALRGPSRAHAVGKCGADRLDPPDQAAGHLEQLPDQHAVRGGDGRVEGGVAHLPWVVEEAADE